MLEPMKTTVKHQGRIFELTLSPITGRFGQTCDFKVISVKQVRTDSRQEVSLPFMNRTKSPFGETR